MSRRKKLLVTAAVVVTVGVLAALGTYGAFTATTANTGNSISSGTLSLTDTDGGTGKLYVATGTAPGTSQTQKCIRVTNAGSLNATVKLYRTAVNSGTGDDYTLNVHRGGNLTNPGADMNCDGFDFQGTVYTGDLGGLGTTYDGGSLAWNFGGVFGAGEWHDYRFTITTKDDATPNAHTQDNATGSHDFVFEARSN